ncbi:RHO4 [Candida metapsilosis]|uniref:RHO4 n=1 Tax=Candida metapsilosis TaxID=273372 RepID=A0A8H7ZL99_9ASCO|nr:RHO4 [Candida metapsilosis]
MSPSKHSSPQFQPSPSFNPYETIQEQQQKQLSDLYQSQSNLRIVTQNDPHIPNYKEIPMSGKKSDYSMKIVVAGDGAVGKTCLLVSYTQNQFPEIYVPTVFENYVTTLSAPNGKSFELALWDTAGQEEYDRLRPLSYRDADLILICFSLDSLTSLQNIKDKWFPEIKHYCPTVPIILVGTKSDLSGNIPPQLPPQIALEIGAITYIECSAKTMFHVRAVFNLALEHFQKEMERQEQYQASNKRRLLRRSNGGSSSGNHGHLRNKSSTSSSRRGHKQNGSLGSSVLIDEPLTEDTYQSNPYGSFNGDSRNNGEFDFINERKKMEKKKCVIL